MNIEKYLPLTETTFLILVSLTKSRHGYGIIQNVEQISKGRIVLGPGTLYGALGKLEKQNWIEKDLENSEDRRKNYILTDNGILLLEAELTRLKELVEITTPIITNRGERNEK